MGRFRDHWLPPPNGRPPLWGEPPEERPLRVLAGLRIPIAPTRWMRIRAWLAKWLSWGR